MQHCPSDCHTHTLQQYEGVASGQFVAPDHEYPSYLELRLTVRDAAGANKHGDRRVAARRRRPHVRESAPAGLQLVVGAEIEGRPIRQAGDRRLEQLGERFITAGCSVDRTTRFRAGRTSAPSRITSSRLSRRQRTGQSSSRCRYQQLPSREGTLPKAIPVRTSLLFTVTLAPATRQHGDRELCDGRWHGSARYADYGQVSGTLTFESRHDDPHCGRFTVFGDAIDEVK